MTASPQGGRSDEDAPGPADSLTARICKRVIKSLGRPDSLFRVEAHPVGDGNWRVNVLMGADATSSRIAHSYFLKTDGEGNIASSSPRIARLY